MSVHALILRDAARAVQTVKEFERLGIKSTCAQLIETQWPHDLDQVRKDCEQLLHGEFHWLVLTSVNTVKALASLLAGRELPTQLKLAVVGTQTARAVQQRLGRDPQFIPQEQSAAGMVSEWELPVGSRIFYPHGDLASSTLADGLRELGVHLRESIVYYTVAAGTGGEPLEPKTKPAGINEIDPTELGAALAHTDLVVFTAPSIVRRFVHLVGNSLPAQVQTLAIGRPTAAALELAGLKVSLIAGEPTPTGLAVAAQQLFSTKDLKK